MFPCGKFLIKKKTFSFGKLPLSRKHFCLLKTSLIKEKYWLVGKFDHGKIIGLSPLKKKLYNKIDTSVLFKRPYPTEYIFVKNSLVIVKIYKEFLQNIVNSIAKYCKIL